MPCVACTYMPNASWRRRGVATARGGGSPTLETKRSESGKGVAKRRAAQAQRGSLGTPLAGARGGAPLSRLVYLAWARSAGIIGEGVAGRNGPQRWERRTGNRVAEGRRLPPSVRRFHA